MRARVALPVVAAIAVLAISGGAFAKKKPAAVTTSAPVIVSVQSTKRIKVQVAEGSTMPCDSLDNRMLFNSTLGNGQAFEGKTEGQCVCVRHTTDAFPSGGWSESKMVCRPRTCKGRICKPAPDPSIKLEIRASQP